MVGIKCSQKKSVGINSGTELTFGQKKSREELTFFPEINEKALNSYLDELTFLLKKSEKSVNSCHKNSFFFARLRRATFFSIIVGNFLSISGWYPYFFSRAFGARFLPLFTTFPRLQMYTFNKTFTKTTGRDLQKIYKFYKNHQSCQELQNFANFTKTTRRDLQKNTKFTKIARHRLKIWKIFSRVVW